MCPGLALGFASSAHSWHLISSLFPDKIGGRPAWLALQNLPKPNQLACAICSQPMAFLLQVRSHTISLEASKVYSMLDKRADCFHRSLFVFMCRNGQCHRSENPAPFGVFRSQLARNNAYYRYFKWEFFYLFHLALNHLKQKNQHCNKSSLLFTPGAFRVRRNSIPSVPFAVALQRKRVRGVKSSAIVPKPTRYCHTLLILFIF